MERPLWIRNNPKTRKPESGIWNLESAIRNPETGNQKPETGNRKPETGNQNPQIKENKVFKYSKIVLPRFLPVKNKPPSKKDLKLKKKNSPSFEIRATVISGEGYDENLRKVRRNFIPSTLRASKISLLVIAILFNK